MGSVGHCAAIINHLVHIMSKEKLEKLSPAQEQAVADALASLTFLKLVARVQGVGIAKLSKRDIEGFVRAADRESGKSQT
jgi:hypothetical protein